MRRSPSLAAALAAATLVLAACGSDDGGSTDTAGASGGDSAQAEAAAERIAPFLEPATSINVETPLEATPEAGKQVVWLEGNIEDIVAIGEGMKEATTALGWDMRTLTYDTADPQAINGAMLQAVQQKPDFISTSGQPVSTYEEAAKAAMAADIPIFDMSSENEPLPEENGIYVNVGRVELPTRYQQVADWVIADSNAQANVVLVNLPDFSVLVTAMGHAKDQFEKECDDCTVAELDATIADLTSGAIPSQVVSYLQSNPDVTHLVFAIGQIASGVREAMEGAGVGQDVKISGANPQQANTQALIDGGEHSWLTLPRAAQAWNAVDAMARYDQGMDLTEINEAPVAYQFWTQDNVPEPASEYLGAEDYQEQWKEALEGRVARCGGGPASPPPHTGRP